MEPQSVELVVKFIPNRWNIMDDDLICQGRVTELVVLSSSFLCEFLLHVGLTDNGSFCQTYEQEVSLVCAFQHLCDQLDIHSFPLFTLKRQVLISVLMSSNLWMTNYNLTSVRMVP